MSVLIPGKGPILHRVCVGVHRWELLDWFASVEARVWRRVHSQFKSTKPKSLFLVTGQTLTNDYKITHQKNPNAGCNIEIEYLDDAEMSLADSMVFKSHDRDQNLYLGYAYKSISGTEGFEVTKPQNDTAMHSVFLEVVESQPIKSSVGGMKEVGDFIR